MRVNQVEPLDSLWVDCFATLGVALYGWLSQQADTVEFNQSPPRWFQADNPWPDGWPVRVL
jgi:hypothetical protein